MSIWDFSENNTVETIEAVPVDFRGLYSEGDDGSFALRSDDDGVKSAISAIQRLGGALKSSRAEVATISKTKSVDLSALSDYGTSVDDIAAGITAKLAELNTQLDNSKGKKSAEEIQTQIDRVKTDMLTAHKAEMDARDGKITTLGTQLHTVMVSDVATREIGSAGGDPELLMPFVAPSLKTMEVEGKLVVRVVDQNGDVRYSGSDGAPLSIAGRVAEIKSQEKFGKFFSSDSPSGGGATPTNRSPQNVKRSDMTPNQKIASGLKKGQAGRPGNGFAR